jgi:hypothetical protein
MLITICTFIQFETISHFLSPHEPPPSMLLDRTDEEDNIILPNSTTHRMSCSNASTTVLIRIQVHGYNGIILEVTDLSQVVSVMLF